MKDLIRKILKEGKEEHTVTIAGVVFKVDEYISENDVFLVVVNKYSRGINMEIYNRVKAELASSNIVKVSPQEYNTAMDGSKIISVYKIRISINLQEIIAMYFDTMVNNKNLFDKI